MISVVIPAYNSGKLTINAIKSVLRQTYENWEIVIIDDGSTDDTFYLIQSFLKSLNHSNNERINLYNQINQGPSSARNNGVKFAKGDYIAFLDSDDEWKQNKLALQLSYFEKDPEIYLCGAGFEKRKFKEEIEFETISFNKLMFKNYFSTPTVLVKTEVFSKYNFNIKQKYSEDYRLWLTIAYDHKCIYVNSILANNQLKKREFGDSGLSSHLWKMQKGEMSNFIFLFKSRRINVFELIFYCNYSFLKFIIRICRSL
ncbi:glycosyltransferase family A protein [Flavobacterium sp. KBS0721]|uniref:glycosyltransferase family 2 protein n=1 Tax=Flavobacterium sp. KBS0721 TaxID=1179672 RepID=UPI00098FF96D|nr:glycosyltransferase family A protein [Flavobacterium sp. KBS0721]QDW18871.1 glycosyltransferase family 2 protein [Flavobacterium sp. KBS0721]